MSKLLVICIGPTCRKYGSVQLLSFAQQEKNPEIEIKTQYCFGKCGNGCVIFCLPEEVFYTNVNKNVLSLLMR